MKSIWSVKIIIKCKNLKFRICCCFSLKLNNWRQTYNWWSWCDCINNSKRSNYCNWLLFNWNFFENLQSHLSMKGTKGTSQRRYESSIENIVIKILENCQTYLGTFSWNIKNTVSIYFASCIISHRRICLWSMLVHPVGACNYRVMQKSFMHCHHIFWVCFDYEKTNKILL